MRDVPALRRLEIEKWRTEGATEDLLAERIRNTPGLSWGAFEQDGLARASCFIMGAQRADILAARSWAEITAQGTAATHDPRARFWFGISLSSEDARDLAAVLIEVSMAMLRRGIRAVYLGSPLPGFRRWKVANPEGTVDAYVHGTLAGGSKYHADPALQYYLGLGFKIVQTLPDYFPHEASMNYGVVLRFDNRLWWLSRLFRLVGPKLFRRHAMRIVARWEPI